MKGKIFIAVLITAVVYGAFRYNGYFERDLQEIRGWVSRESCNKTSFEIIVISVTDTVNLARIGKRFNLERLFKQSDLNQFIEANMRGDSTEFQMAGYWIDDRKLHCSGASCFQVRKIKKVGERSYTSY